MRQISFLFLFLCLLALVACPVSASYNQTFDAASVVVVNQSFAQDPTHGESTPWVLWFAAGFIGLALIVLSLVRSKTLRMDYEINIILSVMAWPFCWYFTWGGLTSVDYIVGVGVTATCSDSTIMMTQHILYSFWVLGYVGVAGCVFAAFITALLASQYKLFVDNETEATAQRQQREMTDDKQ
jgi:hypothetical protein